MTRKLGFAEGRALRVRMGRPDACQGTSLQSPGGRKAGGLTGTCLSEANSVLAGVGSPPLRFRFPKFGVISGTQGLGQGGNDGLGGPFGTCSAANSLPGDLFGERDFSLGEH